jgi:hypothetical protein
MNRKHIVLGNATLASYPEGGGHWMVFLQYLLGLRKLGHDVKFIECLKSTGIRATDEERIQSFFKRFKEYDLDRYCYLLLFDKTITVQDLAKAETFGANKHQLKSIIEKADILWNFCTSIRQPLLGMFSHSVLIDLDPGHLQVSALDWNLDIQDHASFLTVGGKMKDFNCVVPKLGLEWKTFKPFVYLPLWKVPFSTHIGQAFTSITHWNWDELDLDGRRLSLSKREAYMRYIDLPQLSNCSFELATYIEPNDQTGDRELLQKKEWKIVDPWTATASPKDYQDYIANSLAEISCPKPIFRELKTGWFSDRSVCYLASGRPVLAEDTGFSDFLPTGDGLLVFHDMDEAVAGVNNINTNYQHHMKAARRLAEEVFNSEICLNKMLEQC